MSFQDFISNKDMGPHDILKFVKCYSIQNFVDYSGNSCICRTKFSKLKWLKSYMRSTMTQQRLNGLTTIALENDVPEKTKYENVM